MIGPYPYHIGDKMIVFFRYALFSIVLILLGGTLLLRLADSNHPTHADNVPDEIRIATTEKSILGWSTRIAHKKNFFQKNGIRPVFLYNRYGKENLQDMLEGKADIAISSETPFVRAVLKKEPICALAVLTTARDHIRIIARKDSGIQSPKDLRGKRIGLVPDSNGEYLLDLVLTMDGLEPDAVRRVDLAPKEMIHALEKGEIDAATIWKPFNVRLLAALGENGIEFDAKGIYSSYFVLSTRKSFLEKEPEKIEKVLRSLAEVPRFYEENPQEMIDILSEYVPEIKREGMQLSSKNYDVGPRLDQAFVYTLEDQARWMIRKGEVESAEMPNILNYICPEPLGRVLPENMRIIR